MTDLEVQVKAHMKHMESLFPEMFPVSSAHLLRDYKQLTKVLKNLQRRFPYALGRLEINEERAWAILVELSNESADSYYDEDAGGELNWKPIVQHLHIKNERERQLWEKIELTKQGQWFRSKIEHHRALVLVSGVIIGLLFAAALMPNTPNWIRGWALVPIWCFSAVILNLLLAVFPLISHMIISNDPNQKGMDGVLRRLVQIGMWRVWWRWRIRRVNGDKHLRADHMTVTFTKNGRVLVHRSAADRFLRLTYVWFTAGILTSIVLVVLYILGGDPEPTSGTMGMGGR